MSFAPVIGGVVSAGNLAWDLYTKCYLVIQDAPQEFRDLVDSLSSVRNAMRNLEEEVKNPESALSRAGEDRIRNVVAMVGAITRTLKAVEKIVSRYQVIVEPTGDLRSYGRRLWSKIKWSVEVKTIQDLKQKLMFHTNTINLYLMTVGNSSLGRIETIMHMLVASLSPQMHAEINATELENTSLHLTSHELSLGDNTNSDPEARFQNAVLGSNHIQELPVESQNPAVGLSGVKHQRAAELPGGDNHQAVELPASHEWQITAEETVAVEEIFAEAERKLLRHGRPSVLPSRNNSVRKNPLGKIQRKPIPTPQGKQEGSSYFPAPGAIKQTPESIGQTQMPSMSSTQTPPPRPDKIAISYEKIRDETAPVLGNLSSSVNYMPTFVVEQALLTFKSIHSNTDKWPSDFSQWLRIAEWWFLKGELFREEHQSLTPQAYVNFAKCSWILGQLAQGVDGFKYQVSEEDEMHYSRLLKKIEMDYINQDTDIKIPTRSSDLYGLDIELLEPTQPEESGIIPQHSSSSFLDEISPENKRVVFRSFVAIEFGISRPSRPAADIARSYLLLLHFNAEYQTAFILLCNQTGSLRIVKQLERDNVGPELDGSNIRNWIDFDFNGQMTYAGFSSTEAAVPYAVEYNHIRREILERPACILEMVVEKARYIAQGNEVNPVGVGPASLALMEMNKAEDQQSHYREIIMRGHFTTKEIPLHVIKIIQSPSSPVRVQLWWPTFEIPREDIRDFVKVRYQPYAAQKTSDERYFNPHLRESQPIHNTMAWGSLFILIKYRSIEERLLDIDVTTQSDRMLDVIFRTPKDAKKFIMGVGGMAPRVTERIIFEKIASNREIRLFRVLDGTIRLCYKESDTYCSFIIDKSSSYNITTDGSIALWSIMWSPFGNAERKNYSYLSDSIDLGVFQPQERDQLIASLMFPETQMQCASIKIRNLAGFRGGVAGKIAKTISSLRVSAEEAMLVLYSTGGVIIEAVFFGTIVYRDCSRASEVLRLTTKVVRIQEGKVNESKGKIAIHLTVDSPRLHSFNRERSIIKQAREPTTVQAEVGGLQFTVDDISMWRAAFTRLTLPQDAVTLAI